MITLTFPIEPVPKGRPRFDRRGFARTPEPTRRFESEVRTLARSILGPHVPMTCPLRVTLLFVFKRPKSVKREHHTVKPDLDNLIKSVIDPLNRVVWVDDSQIRTIEAHKVYDPNGGGARIVLQVEEIGP